MQYLCDHTDNPLTCLCLQATVYETLHALCLRLPGEQASVCDSQVKSYLPKVVQQTPGHLVSSPLFTPPLQAPEQMINTTVITDDLLYQTICVFCRNQLRPVWFLDSVQPRRRKGCWNLPTMLQTMTTYPALILTLQSGHQYEKAEVKTWSETYLFILHTVHCTFNQAFTFLGTAQSCLHPVFVCRQETGDHVAQKYDWGDTFLCVSTFVVATLHYTSHNVNVSNLFCLVLQDALMKLMGEVCDLVPKSYKDKCNDFVSKYGVQIVEFLLSSAAPHTICTLLHLCLFEEKHVPGQSQVHHE